MIHKNTFIYLLCSNKPEIKAYLFFLIKYKIWDVKRKCLLDSYFWMYELKMHLFIKNDLLNTTLYLFYLNYLFEKRKLKSQNFHNLVL